MPLFSNLFGALILACVCLGLIVVGVWAAAKRNWWVVVYIVVCSFVLWLMLWLIERGELLGTFEAGGSQISVYYIASDEGFIEAKLSGRARKLIDYDVPLGQGVDASAKVRGYYSARADGIWLFTESPSNITKQPVIIYLGNGKLERRPESTPMPDDAVELVFKR